MRHNLGLDNPGIPGNVDLAKKKGPKSFFSFAEKHPGSGNPVFLDGTNCPQRITTPIPTNPFLEVLEVVGITTDLNPHHKAVFEPCYWTGLDRLRYTEVG